MTRARNRPVPLDGFGSMDWGAPSPVLVVAEHAAALAYYLNAPAPDWDGANSSVRNPVEDAGPMALVVFDPVWKTRTGLTDKDHVHPDHAGVNHGVFEILDSDWAATLPWEGARHLVFAFHDDVAEVLCKSWETTFVTASAADALSLMRERLFRCPTGRQDG